MIAHITAEELKRELTDIEAGNGFANRFIWVLSKRSKFLPRGGRIGKDKMDEIAQDLSLAQSFAKGRDGALDLEAEAWALWDSRYQQLATGRPGLTGSILARGAPHVLRLALIYALLDCSETVRSAHLRAALAVWGYCERSVRLIFGSATGYPDADTALKFIRSGGKIGRTTTEIRDLFPSACWSSGGKMAVRSQNGHRTANPLRPSRLHSFSRRSSRGVPCQIWATVMLSPSATAFAVSLQPDPERCCANRLSTLLHQPR